MLTLRCAVLAVLACVSVAQYHNGLYRRSYPYYNPYPLSACTTDTPCFDYTLTITTDGNMDLTSGNATHFREHYRLAGFSRNEMIAEGRKAGEFFKERYGIDIGTFSGQTYLEPNEQLPNGMSFTFVTHRNTLYMGSKKDFVSFINTPGSAVWWNINIPNDYTSTGTYSGTIPGGSRVYFGSLLFDVCPKRGIFPYRPCLFSNNQSGRKFIRLTPVSFLGTFKPGPFVLINSMLDDEWGKGESRGVFIKDTATGITTGSALLTFPSACSAGGCVTR